MKCTQSYFKLVLFALKQFEKIKLGFYLINFSDCIIWRMKKCIYKRYLECFSVFGFQHRWKQHLIILRGSQVIAAAIILFSLNFIRFSTCEMRRLNRALHVNPFFFKQGKIVLISVWLQLLVQDSVMPFVRSLKHAFALEKFVFTSSTPSCVVVFSMYGLSAFEWPF